MKQMFSKARQDRSGIALVIVLGLLSVLTILALSFSITMRTERMAAEYHVSAVSGRHLIDAALTEVMTDVLRNSLGNSVYPDWDTLPPPGGHTSSNFHMVDVLERYVPGSMLDAATSADNPNPDWIEIRDPTDDKFMGKYSYLIINCSGLLDANTVGEFEDQTTARRYGADVGEVRFGNLVLDEARDPESLKNLRDQIGRFENVPELIAMGTSGTIEPNFPIVQGTRADNFHVFSRFPTGYGVVEAAGVVARTNSAYIGGNPNTEWNETAIKTVLNETPSLPIPDVDMFYDVMHDFASPGYVPRNVDGVSFKRTPMLSEIIVSNTLQLVSSGPDTELVLRVHVDVETFYPFPQDPDSPPFTVQIDGTPTVQTPFPPLNAISLVDGPTPAQPGHSEFDLRLTKFVYESRVNTSVFPFFPPPFGIRVIFNGIDFTVNLGSDVVDRLTPSWPNDAFQIAGAFPPLLVDGDFLPYGTARGRSVNDPRMNYESSQWTAETPTPGETNINVSGSFPDEVGFMFSAQRPFASPGELSYLIYDETKPWQTVRLLGPDPDESARIVDRFTTRQPTAFDRGLVNINTRQTNALAAVFWGLPVERHPIVTDDISTAQVDDPLSATAAKALAEFMVSAIDGQARTMSEIAQYVETADMAALGSDTSKFFRESAIRNSLGLLGVRHNMFTVYIAVRTFPENYDPDTALPSGMTEEDMVMSETRAVAVVWRDPYLSGSSSGHEMFVRFFAILTDFGSF